MDGVRLLPGVAGSTNIACCRCGSTGCPWDRIAGKVLCPDCQESLALGDAPAIFELAVRRPCTICHRPGTLPYLTFPLHANGAVEIDLCSEHLDSLLSRRLDRHAFHQIDQQLRILGLAVRQVFLLHDAFYDEHGRPLQPVPEAY